MDHISYFKSLAKKLHKDFKTQYRLYDEDDDSFFSYQYSPKFFDVDGIVVAFDLDEESVTLMKAQHYLALILGFKNWVELINTDDHELELARLLFDHSDKIAPNDWRTIVLNISNEGGCDSAEAQIGYFKELILNRKLEYVSDYHDFRLHPKQR